MADTTQHDSEFRALIETLVRSLHESTELRIPGSGRGMLVEALERVLIDPFAMEVHLKLLAQLNRPRVALSSHLEVPAKLNEIVEGGLKHLDDRELSVLALSPFQLRDVADELENRGLNDFWWRIVENSSDNPVHQTRLASNETTTQIQGVPNLATALGSGDQQSVQLQRFEFHWRSCKWTSEPVQSLPNLIGQITAHWVDGELRVAVGGFLDVEADGAFEVVWTSVSGAEKAKASVTGKAGEAELVPNDGWPPQFGERLRLTHEWNPSQGEGWKLQIDAFYVRGKLAGALVLADALIATRLQWESITTETLPQLGAFVAAMLCTNAAFRPIASSSGQPDVKVEQLLDSLILDFEAGTAVTVTDESFNVQIAIDQKALLIRTYRGSTEAIDQFRVEFRRGHEIVGAADSQDGAVQLSLEQFRNAHDGEVDRICIVV